MAVKRKKKWYILAGIVEPDTTDEDFETWLSAILPYLLRVEE